MAQILGVHGAFHEMWGPTQVLNRWRPALQDGALIAGGELPDDAVAVAFYGDLFRHEPTDGGLDDEHLRVIAQASGLAEMAQQTFGPDAVAVLSKAIGEDMLRRTIDQVGRYFGDASTRAAVRARVCEQVRDDTRVIVAHSLGSIVAYDCLRANPDWPVRTFVTIGSPLGNKELVLAHLETDPNWPGSLERWVNISAPTDMVCAGSALAPVYDARVEDVVVDNGHRAHDPEPYLCARETGQVLLAALGRS
jgi:hypothetical protein